MWVVCIAAGLCRAWYRHLAASVEGKLRVNHSQRELPRCIGAVHRVWRTDSHHWILWLLRSHHGEPVHAADGQSRPVSGCIHIGTSMSPGTCIRVPVNTGMRVFQ